MEGVSVSKLSRNIGVPVDQVIHRLNEVGCKVTSQDDIVTGNQQLLLLQNLGDLRSERPRGEAVGLQDIERADTLEALNQLLTRSMADLEIQALVKGSNLDVVVDTVFRLSRQASEELLASATIGRLAAVVRGERGADLLAGVGRIFTQEPPSLESLVDGETKAYAAASLKYVEKPWVSSYIAREAVVVDTADNARRELLSDSLFRAKSISNWLHEIVDQATNLTKIQPVSRQRRIRRVSGIMKEVVQQWRGDVGEDIGSALSDSLRGFFRSMKMADLDDQILFEIVDNLLSILERAIELRFSYALSSETYQIIGQGRQLLGLSLWRRYLRSSSVVPSLRTLLLEAALVLARQNRTDSQLADVLVTCYSSRKQAAAAIGKHLKVATDLDPQQASWWSSAGQSSESQGSPEQKIGNTVDELIGALLIEVERNRIGMDKVGRAVVPLLEISDEILAATVRKAVGVYREIEQTVGRLARMRKLARTDLVGTLIEYNPLEHELLEGHRSGVRRVKVVRDGVRKDFGGVVKTLVKPWVETDRELEGTGGKA